MKDADEELDEKARRERGNSGTGDGALLVKRRVA